MRETKNRSPQRRIAAVVGALTLGVIGVGGAAAPAMAANIDPSATGSIIIHKGIQKGAVSPGSPTGTEPGNFTGLAGVQFTAYKLDSILATNAGWEQLDRWAKGTDPLPASIVNGTACNNLPPTVTGQIVNPSGTATTSLTNGSGQATIENLNVGAYVVCETQSPSTVVDKAQPFIISIPYPDSTNGGWLYNPHVWPKNGVAAIKKEVAAQTSLGLGSTVSFPTTVTVPRLSTGSHFTHFWIQDPLDSRLTGGTATVSAVTSTGTALALAEGTDYRILPPSTANANLVTVEFTRAGLNKLEDNPGAQVTATFKGTVSSLAPVSPSIGDVGEIGNVAYADSATANTGQPGTSGEPTPPVTTPGGSGNPGNPTIPGTENPSYHGTPSNKVISYWGDVKLHKVDKVTPAANGLAGARFQVYEAANPYPDAEGDCATATTGGAIQVSGHDDFTSIAGGLLTVPGLFVKDNDGHGSSSAFRCYVLREIEAPAGYVTPTGTLAFTAVAVKVGETATYDVEVSNTQISGVQLPMTGSDGIIVFSIAGAALVALGLIVATASRRRRSHTA